MIGHSAGSRDHSAGVGVIARRSTLGWRTVAAAVLLATLAGCQTIVGNEIERNTPSVMRPAHYSYLDTWSLEEAKREGNLWVERHERPIAGALRRKIDCTVMYNIDEATLSPDAILQHYGKLVQRIVVNAGSTEVSVETGHETMGVQSLLRFKAEFDVPGVESWSRGGSVLREKEVKLPWRFDGTVLDSGTFWMAAYCLASEEDSGLSGKFLETVNTSFSVGDVQI